MSASDDLYAQHDSPDDWYRLWLWMDEVFSRAIGWKEVPPWRYISSGVVPRPPSPHHREIVASIDLERIGQREKYLMKMLTVQHGLYRRLLNDFPNLRALQDVGEIDEPIVLSAPPRGAYDPWLLSRGVVL